MDFIESDEFSDVSLGISECFIFDSKSKLTISFNFNCQEYLFWYTEKYRELAVILWSRSVDKIFQISDEIGWSWPTSVNILSFRFFNIENSSSELTNGFLPGAFVTYKFEEKYNLCFIRKVFFKY